MRTLEVKSVEVDFDFHWRMSSRKRSELCALGYVGLYPLGRTKTGESVALLPVHGKSILSWPALMVGSSGEHCTTLSTLRGLVRGLMAAVDVDEFRWLKLSDFQACLPSYRALSSLLGDERLVNDAVLRIESILSIRDGLSKRGSPQETMALASPDSPRAAYIQAAHSVRFHGRDPIDAYTQVLREYPTHRVTLAAMAKSAKKLNKSSIRNGAMLGLLKGHNGIDNDPAESTPEVLSLSLFNLKQAKSLMQSRYAPLIQRMDNDFGQGYFDVARALHRGGKPKSAILAYQNAIYWSVKGYGSVELQALEAAMDCAAYLDAEVHKAFKYSTGFKAKLLARREAEKRALEQEKATYWLKYID